MSRLRGGSDPELTAASMARSEDERWRVVRVGLASHGPDRVTIGLCAMVDSGVGWPAHANQDQERVFGVGLPW